MLLWGRSHVLPALIHQPVDSAHRFFGFEMTANFRIVILCLALAVDDGRSGCAEEWWQFRGPHAGHVAEKDVPLQWGGFFREPTWKTFIPGKGWSSPIVVGDRVWLTSAEEVALDADAKARKLADLPFGSLDIVADAAVKLFVLELDAATGAILQRIDLFEHADPPPVHSMNSYASPTPVTDGTRIICHFGALGTACLDCATGNLLWKRTLVIDELTGGGASPVLWGDCVYLACDGADQQYVIAIDKFTGATKWQVPRPAITAADNSQRRSFSTPLIVNSGGRDQLISAAAQWLVSYNPLDGSEWWRAKVGSGYSLVPTPVFDRDRVFICTGFTTPELVAVDTRGNGDVTDTAILWKYSRQVPEISSPLVVGDEVYFISSKGILSCVDTATGTLHWQHRLSGKFAASLTYAADRIYVTSCGGVTTVIQPGHTFVELATNELFGETSASLAVYQQSFLLRTSPFLFRLNRQ